MRIKESFETDLLYDLFQAYYDTRRNKRSTINAISFEIDYESKLFQLYEEIKNREYKISRSIGFIIFNPVQREIFASDFRDRIVHHLIYNYINPIFERRFINDCYNCRTGKGTSYGVKRLAHFVRSCSRNYTRDCYILKLDIEGYFMSIDRSLLHKIVEGTLNRFCKNVDFDMDLILYLIRKVVFNDPVKQCVIKGSKNDWNGLPKSKSLFFAGKNKGFPIGNLTSQLFGNVYLNEFDHFIKYRLGFKYYGRYVDDLVIIHPDKEYLKSIIPLLREYLQDQLLLKLHPKKIYLQHYSKGVNFLGTVIKPYRNYIGNRTKGNFYQRIQYWNNFISEKQFKLTEDNIKRFLSSMNSYLGIISNCKTYKLRKKMLKECLSAHFWKYVYISAGSHKKLAIKIS
ncbi:MAG: reverse transcriptase domain-containing protein [Candidatus Anammoxibacter sp.]